MPIYVCTYKSTDGPDGISLECFFTPSLHEAKERMRTRNTHLQADFHGKIYRLGKEQNLGKYSVRQRVYLTCCYEEKDAVKRLGAYWDADKRQWYVPDHLDLHDFDKWLPERFRAKVIQDDTKAEVDDDIVVELFSQDFRAG